MNIVPPARQFWSLVLFMVVGVAAAASAQAGLVVEQVRYKMGSNDIESSRIYISRNKLRFDENDGKLVTVFDLDKGNMLQIDSTRKVYVRATPKEYADFFKSLRERIARQMKEQLENLPPEQREQMKAMMRSQGITPPDEEAKPVKLTVKDTGVKEKVSGFATRKYAVYRDGRLDEELWITTDKMFTSEFDTSKLARYMKELQKISAGAGPAQEVVGEEEYVRLIYGNGFPLKVVDHGMFNTVHVEEVKSVVKKKLSSSLFAPPPGYKQVKLDVFLMGLGKGR